MFDIFSKRNRESSASDTYRYDVLPQQLKVQILHIFRELLCKFPAMTMSIGRGGVELFFGRVSQTLCKEYGLFRLTENSRTCEEDVSNFFLQERNVDKCLDVIEVVFALVVNMAKADPYVNFAGMDDVRIATDELNARFQEHAIGYEFRENKIIRIDSKVLHKETVIPALVLLRQPYLTGADQEFSKALEHFRHQLFGESINECLKAFESTMKAICHKRHWNYQQKDTAKVLLATCEKNGLFPAFMQSSLSGLRSVLETVPTVRNKLSGHGQGVQQVQISEEVAAFVLHSTAANILFLASLEKGKM